MTTREQYQDHYVDSRKYFEFNTFCEEFAKPWDRRRLPFHRDPREAKRAGALDVDRMWRRRNPVD